MRKKLLLLAGVVLSAISGIAQAQSGFNVAAVRGGGADLITPDGRVLSPDKNRAALRLALPESGQLHDATYDARGNLLVALLAPEGLGQAFVDFQGHILVFDSRGQRLVDVLLPPRWTPARVAAVGRRVAVAATSPEEGWAVHFLDADYRLLPEARIFLSFGCEGLDLLDMAAVPDGSGIWVAPLERCGDGYVVRKYDLQGHMAVEIRHPAQPAPRVSAASEAGNTVTPALKGIFATSLGLGAILNAMGPDGTLVDLWTPSGDRVTRGTLQGVRGALIRVLPLNARELAVVDLGPGSIQSISNPQLEEEHR